MLSGTHVYTVDAKGRVVMPRVFASELGSSFVLTRAPGRCLLALPRPRWVRFLRGFGKNRTFRTFRTFFLASAENVTLAQANRFQVPLEFRDWATLQGGAEVVVAGIGGAVVTDHHARWEARLLKVEQDLVTALERPDGRLCSECRGGLV